MISLSQYYEENLYPLQDGILRIVEQCETPFYLTGGTAISRAHYNHRYSDDLDFFVTNDSKFLDYVKIIISALEKSGYVIDKESLIKTPIFTSLKVKHNKPDIFLKLDFVNDLVVHFGDIERTSLFNRTDNVRNILSNKMGALFRFAAKDVADIREIALHNKFIWGDIMKDASQKDAGVQLDLLAQLLRGMPEERFNELNWIKNPSWDVFCKDIQKIAEDMIKTGENSLCK